LFVNFSVFHLIVRDKMQIIGRLTKPVISKHLEHVL